MSRCAAVACLAALFVVGCGSARGPLPTRIEPIAFVDTLPIAEPAEFKPLEATGLLQSAFIDEFGRIFSIRRWAGSQHAAANLTRFDDVVGSAWYQHRIDRRSMTPEEVARGPAVVFPAVRTTLTVMSGKREGRSPGFVIRDVRGFEYLLKFDPPGFQHLTTAAEVISSRLFHAAGYNTPENYIAVIDTSLLVLHPEAQMIRQGRQVSMERADLEAVFARTEPLPNGRFLAVASRILPGTLKGPFLFSGRRQDDANDYYYHEHRRELRGLRVVAAWLNHVDLRFTNTLDVFEEPGYLRHYLIDFGETLGSATVKPHEPRAGREHNFDLAPVLSRLFSLGFFRMPWQMTESAVIHSEIGWMPVEDFDPKNWKPRWPNEAFLRMTASDGYWGAKIVGSFTDAQIRAAVKEGQLSPVAADTLAKILSFRRDRTIEYWYAQVTPIEDIEVHARSSAVQGSVIKQSGITVSFDDLAIRQGVRAAADVSYDWRFKHPARGIDLHGRADASDTTGRQTIEIAFSGERPGQAAGSEPSFAVLQINTARVHLSWSAATGYQVVGLEH